MDLETQQGDLPFDTLLGMTRWRAAQADAIGYTFLPDGEGEEQNLTYAELDQRCRALAGRLQALCRPGDRALLLFDPGLEYLIGLFGCFYAGLVPVPAYPPDLMRTARTLPRLQAITRDCLPAVVLGTASSLKPVALALGEGENAPIVLPIDNWPEWGDLPWTPPSPAPDSPALLQYTSGSTDTPRGVVVTHANALYNFRSIHTRDLPDAVAVSWLPMYHDMGLVGGALATCFSGRRLVFFSPLAFVQRPIRWLLAISRYHATTTGAPNFGYDLCVSRFKPEDALDLDLSSWKIAVTGAEPIRADTLARFTATFAPYGFRPDAWAPCYGLAEATLGVSGPREGSQHAVISVSAEALERNTVRTDLDAGEPFRRLVGCGYPPIGTDVKIVDPSTCLEVSPDGVGEIWVRGPGVAAGYWNRPKDNASLFDAHLADSGEGPFLRTGDLGFFFQGQLYLTGRLKEIMIFRGRNIYPQDVERTVARCHRVFRPQSGAAFSVEKENNEALVVVQEVPRAASLDLETLASSLRGAVLTEHHLPLHALVLIRAGTLPKTSSGKVQRRGCRERFLSGQLDIVRSWLYEGTQATVSAPPSRLRDARSVQLWLTERLAQQLGVAAKQIDPDEPINRYVMDSVSLMILAMDLEDWLGGAVPPEILFDAPSLTVLARRLTAPRTLEASPPNPEQMSESELDRALNELLERQS